MLRIWLLITNAQPIVLLWTCSCLTFPTGMWRAVTRLPVKALYNVRLSSAPSCHSFLHLLPSHAPFSFGFTLVFIFTCQDSPDFPDLGPLHMLKSPLEGSSNPLYMVGPHSSGLTFSILSSERLSVKNTSYLFNIFLSTVLIFIIAYLCL